MKHTDAQNKAIHAKSGDTKPKKLKPLTMSQHDRKYSEHNRSLLNK